LWLQFKWKLSASYSPRTQGLAERLVQTLKQCFGVLEDISIPFNLKIGLIQLFHNTSCIGSIPFSPFEVVFGREPSVSPFIDTTLRDGENDYLLRMSEIRSMYRTFRDFMRSRVHDKYASRSPLISIQVGDMVYRTFMTATGAQTSGPYKVVGISGNMFKLDRIDYPIPGYQLRASIDRPRELSFVSESITQVDATQSMGNVAPSSFQIDDLAIYQASDVGIPTYELGRIIEINHVNDFILFQRFGNTSSGEYYELLDQIVEISFPQVIVHPVRLARNKIPKKILRELPSLRGG
jgi:hypothetical protein